MYQLIAQQHEAELRKLIVLCQALNQQLIQEIKRVETTEEQMRREILKAPSSRTLVKKLYRLKASGLFEECQKAEEKIQLVLSKLDALRIKFKRTHEFPFELTKTNLAPLPKGQSPTVTHFSQPLPQLNRMPKPPEKESLRKSIRLALPQRGF